MLETQDVIDHYRTLGVPRGAEKHQIQKAYFKLRRASRNGWAGELPIAAIETAYQTLIDSHRRWEYDRVLDSGYFIKETVLVDDAGKATVIEKSRGTLREAIKVERFDTLGESNTDLSEPLLNGRALRRHIPKPKRKKNPAARMKTRGNAGGYIRHAKRKQRQESLLLAVGIGAPILTMLACGAFLFLG